MSSEAPPGGSKPHDPEALPQPDPTGTPEGQIASASHLPPAAPDDATPGAEATLVPHESDPTPASGEAPLETPPTSGNGAPAGTVPAETSEPYAGEPAVAPEVPAESAQGASENAQDSTTSETAVVATSAPASDGGGSGGGSATADEEEEEGGGPVKPFLDHLEDLRWTLIKVISALAIAMIVCLVASDKITAFLMWPLKHSQQLLPSEQRSVPLLLGTNELGRVQLDTVRLTPAATNTKITALELMPVSIGTNLVLGVETRTTPLANVSNPTLVVLKNYSPLGAFMVALQLALYGGLLLSAPFIIFFVGQFVLPALKVKEKKWLYRVGGAGTLLFITGVAFCYFIIVQVALMASVQFSQWMGFGADEWRAEDYISFVCKFMLGMGLSFQLPLVILTLVKIGLIDYQTLNKYRAYFVMVNLIASGVITPSGDPVTMLLMALPLQFLYEVATLIARAWAKKDREREAQPA